jgi:hypothetical protein
MGSEAIERLMDEQGKDITTSVAFAVKGVGGSYKNRPIEEIYKNAEVYVQAHRRNLLRHDFQPLIDFADMITRRRSLDRFKLHELLRASLSFKRVMYPLLIQQCWEDRDDLVKSIMVVDRATDRFAVNLGQIFTHYAKDYLSLSPLEFPVWVGNPAPGFRGDANS